MVTYSVVQFTKKNQNLQHFGHVILLLFCIKNYKIKVLFVNFGKLCNIYNILIYKTL